MRNVPRLAVGVLLAAALLGGCGFSDDNSPPPLTPMPSHVPKKPQYDHARDVMEALNEAGIDCTYLRESEGNPEAGSSIDCLSKLDGQKFENQIHVLNPQMWTRNEIGDSIAGWRTGENPQNVVAAGNWFVVVRQPRLYDFAPRIAEALDARLLRPIVPSHDPTP